MSLEDADFIPELNELQPTVNTVAEYSQVDDHLRLIKKVLLNTFVNITGPVLATSEQINSLSEISQAINVTSLQNSIVFSDAATQIFLTGTNKYGVDVSFFNSKVQTTDNNITIGQDIASGLHANSATYNAVLTPLESYVPPANGIYFGRIDGEGIVLLLPFGWTASHINSFLTQISHPLGTDNIAVFAGNGIVATIHTDSFYLYSNSLQEFSFFVTVL